MPSGWILLAALLAAAPASAGAAQAPPAADPDRLYANREDLTSAEEAAGVWAARLAADPQDFASAWKLARARYWLGGHATPNDARRAYLESGVEAGRQAARIDPDRPEGHFWMAANMGALAESFGLRQGLRYRGAIKDALERVLAIDAAFQDGSADRALGRWYFKVPRLFGGSRDRAVEHYRRSLEYDPHSTASLFFLAEALAEMDRDDEARAAAERVLEAPINPEWAPEDREFKQQARDLLETLGP